MSLRTLLVRIKQIKHNLTHRLKRLTWIPVMNYLNGKTSQTLSATHISKMRFSSKMIARSNSLYVHFTELGFLSVIKTNAFSLSQKKTQDQHIIMVWLLISVPLILQGRLNQLLLFTIVHSLNVSHLYIFTLEKTAALSLNCVIFPSSYGSLLDHSTLPTSLSQKKMSL